MRRSSIVFTIALSTIAIVLVVGFGASRRVYVLRASDCTKLVAVQGADGNLRIEGAMLHSGLGAGHIETQIEGTRTIVRVYLVPAGQGARQEFNSVVALSADTKEVWFGEPPHSVTLCSIAGKAIHLPSLSNRNHGLVIWRRAPIADKQRARA